MVRIRGVEPLDGYRVRVEFTDNSRREIDLEMYLRGPVFEAIRSDPAVFRTVRVDPQFGTIVWPNGADIDPDVLYHGRKPAWMEELSADANPLAGLGESTGIPDLAQHFDDYRFGLKSPPSQSI